MEMGLQKSMHFLKTRSFPSSAFAHCLQASQSYFRDADSHRGQGGDGHFCHVPLETGARLSSLLQVSAVPVSLCISLPPIHCSWWKATPCSCLSAPPGSISRAPSMSIWKQALPFLVCSKCIPFFCCVFSPLPKFWALSVASSAWGGLIPLHVPEFVCYHKQVKMEKASKWM